MISQQKCRFTLVELLVVMAVIGIIAGLAFPMLSKAMEKSKATACASNLRQIGLALEMYFPDNHWRLPSCRMYPLAPAAGEEALPGIPETLESYVKNPKVFICPADSKGFHKLKGSSYEWASVAGINNQTVDRKTYNILGFVVKPPVMYDGEKFHKELNFLFVPIPKVGKVEDITPVGGTP